MDRPVLSSTYAGEVPPWLQEPYLVGMLNDTVREEVIANLYKSFADRTKPPYPPRVFMQQRRVSRELRGHTHWSAPSRARHCRSRMRFARDFTKQVGSAP